MLAVCFRGVASFSVLRAMFRHRYRRVVVSRSGVSLESDRGGTPPKGSHRLCAHNWVDTEWTRRLFEL